MQVDDASDFWRVGKFRMAVDRLRPFIHATYRCHQITPTMVSLGRTIRKTRFIHARKLVLTYNPTLQVVSAEWVSKNGGGRCSILEMPSLVDLLAQISKDSSIHDYRAPAHTTDRFGNRYFENMNAEEELPGKIANAYFCGVA